LEHRERHRSWNPCIRPYLRFGVLSANTQEALRALAESTGGFLIANTNNTEKLARVMEDVDTHYEISYRPASEVEDGISGK
jgi:hypothetical protein